MSGALFDGSSDACADRPSYGPSFRDALLGATAERIGGRWPITEDFQGGCVVGGVTFVHPFNVANDRLLERELPPPS